MGEFSPQWAEIALYPQFPNLTELICAIGDFLNIRGKSSLKKAESPMVVRRMTRDEMLPVQLPGAHAQDCRKLKEQFPSAHVHAGKLNFRFPA